jgi:hypothetical protein
LKKISNDVPGKQSKYCQFTCEEEEFSTKTLNMTKNVMSLRGDHA